MRSLATRRLWTSAGSALLITACGGGSNDAAVTEAPATEAAAAGSPQPTVGIEAHRRRPPAPTTPTPYSGIPIALPGSIDAANFDLGGQDVAYHDNVAGNAGGLYRTNESVDIIASADTVGGGFTVNNFETGEWLGYTVQVATGGSYDIDLRASSAFSNSAFHVEIDGKDVTGRVAVPNTGAWSAFQWVGAKGVGLTAGTHVLKVVADQQYFNLNGIKVSATAAPISPTAVNFLCSFATLISDCGFGEQSKVPGRASVVLGGRDGPTSLRLHTEPGDNNVFGSGTAERNDVALSQAATDCYQGREHWWAHSILFPSDYVPPPAGGWGVVMDFHHTGSTGQANFHVDAMPDGLRLRGYGGATVDSGLFSVPLGPVVRNVWYDFVYHVKWSSGPDGVFDAWVNGVKKLSHRGPTLYSGMGCYLKLANYHSPSGMASSVIHDRVLRGTSAAAVSATPLQ
jgi:Polysaccharide lyase/Carbohydrate binding module (family 6)